MERKSLIKDPATKRPERGVTLIVTAEEGLAGASGSIPGIVYPFTVYIFLLIREVPLEFIEISAVLAVQTDSGHYLVRQPVNIFDNPDQRDWRSG